MSVRAGMALGQYELLERIGRGGMATVYRAYHPALDRQVAIKAKDGTTPSCLPLPFRPIVFDG
jgi:hypothetical protein